MFKKVASLIFMAIILLGGAFAPPRAQAAPNIPVGDEARLLSIPAAAFRPDQDGYTYANSGYRLFHLSRDGSCTVCYAQYYAPLHLPHGAVITAITAYIADENAAFGGTVSLIEVDLLTGTVSTWVTSVASPVGIKLGYTPYTQSGLSHLVG